MIAPSGKHRFYTKKEAAHWLFSNGFKPIRKMKSWYMNETQSAELQVMPSGRVVVIVGYSDRG